MSEFEFTAGIEGVILNSKKTTKELHRHNLDLDILFDSFISNLSLSCFSILHKYSLVDILKYESALVIDSKKKTKNCSSRYSPKVREFFRNCSETAHEVYDLDYIPPEVLLINFFNMDTMPKCIEELDSDISDSILADIITDVTLFIKDSDFSLEEEFPEEEDVEYPDNLIDMFEDNKILSEFAENLNIQAANKKFDKIVDFDDKISEIATILCRKKKPNAILVGPAGTGKTSLVEGLASEIVNGKVPELITNKVIYSLSLSSMVAGTQYRGQFEERLEKFVNEVKKYDNIILFIDEIHTLVGAGGTTENSLEASNILKPELARGTVSCIGATTINEYTNTIKKDSALDRRFERVTIKEPSKFQMKEILPSITEYYEDFHGVEYSEEFVNSVMDYCEKYTPNKYYPDKAIDVIDHCGAQSKVNYWDLDPEIKELQDQIVTSISSGGVYKDLMSCMNTRLKSWSDRMADTAPEVTTQHLKDFYSKKENPLCKPPILKDVIGNLSKTFVGHRKILKDLEKEILVSNYRLNNKQDSAPSTYCLSGGSPTGKTFFCSLLKDDLEKSGANILFYNGVHFSDEFASYKIASEKNNNTSLCEKVDIHPNSIIVIDDFHKVHASAKTLFAQIFKEGKIQMSNGDIADFTNCKIFLTSSLVESKSMGFNSDSEDPESVVFSELKQYFDCELFLHKLTERDIRRVLWQKLNKIKNSLASDCINLRFKFDFIKEFCSKITSLSTLDEKIESVINKFITESLLGNKSEINLSDIEKKS
jgi:ATP-dependent Clp protease ATP-binding subunit ClpC